MSGVDFGRAAGDYASYRPGFAPRLFERLRETGVGLAGQRVLDVGAGTGLLGRALGAGGVRVVESDASLQLLRQATAKERVAAAAEKLPFGDGVFDAVT